MHKNSDEPQVDNDPVVFQKALYQLLEQISKRDQKVLSITAEKTAVLNELKEKEKVIAETEADLRFTAGPIEYNVAWILLTFLGVFGVHRMYQGKWISGLLYLVTGGLFFLGVLYDFWTLNDQISIRNAQNRGAFQ